MNKPSNAFAKVRSPLPGEAPAVPEHALPAGLVTDGPTGRSAAVADTEAGAGGAAELAGPAGDAAWSGSRAEATDGEAAADGLAGEQSLSYSADEAAWLFGLERVAPTPAQALAQALRAAGAVEAGGSRAAASEPSSAGDTPLPELAQPSHRLEALAGTLAEEPALAEPDVATPALQRPAEESGASPDRSRTDALSAEVTAALLPALDPEPQAPQAAALDEVQALPLAARQTLHLHSLAAVSTPRTAEAVSLEQQVTPPRGTVAYAAGHGPAPVPGPAGQPGAGETTASLLLPANAPALLTLIRPDVPQPGDGLRRAAGSLLANLGMGLLGGLLALGGAAAVLSLRGERTRPQAAVEPAPPGLDAATRTRLLQQVTLALASGRRPVALTLLREYAAASPEPAVEELIRILEREPR